jgi:drug/metabolite transporter (DMT)-like permease
MMRLAGPALGMALGVLSYALFSLHDASIKWLVATIPVWQVLFVRSAMVVAGSLAVGRGALVARLIATPMKRPLLLRGALTLVAWLCYYSAARFLPLAQLLTLYFSSPILVTILAAPLLGERVPPVRWAAVGIGFAGVLVASDPLGVRVSFATGLVLLAAALWAYGIILMRRIARRESSLLQMLTGNLVFMSLTGPLSAFTWHAVGWRDLALLLAVGTCGGLGQFCLFEAARRAPAAVLATVEYSALLWAFLLGFAIWGDIPDAAVFMGAGLILFAGLLLVAFERRSARLRAA